MNNHGDATHDDNDKDVDDADGHANEDLTLTMDLTILWHASETNGEPRVSGFDEEEVSSKQNEMIMQQHARCIGEWLEAFWIPKQQRKLKNMVSLQYHAPSACILVNSCRNGTEDSRDASSAVRKELVMAFKKISVEDLGNLNASALAESIPPDDDKDGRGWNDLHRLEHQLAVKVVFQHDNGHVYLVGARPKIQKKCLVIRNILSHYYWRLSGKEVHL